MTPESCHSFCVYSPLLMDGLDLVACCFFFFFFNYFKIYFYFWLHWVFMHCCVQAFSSCSEQRLFFVVMHRFLIVVASLVGDGTLGRMGSVVLHTVLAAPQHVESSWTRDPTPKSPALQGRFLSTEPPGKSVAGF